MKEYDFTLTFTLSDMENPDQYVEALYGGNCDDALIGVGEKGTIALNFIREAETAYQAIHRAIKDVRGVISQAIFSEAKPDLVGISEIAELIGCTRQNVRKLLKNDASSPSPYYNNSLCLWHLADVLFWLRDHKSYAIDDSLLEVSEVNMKLNISANYFKIDQNTLRDQEIQELAKFAVNRKLSSLGNSEVLSVA